MREITQKELADKYDVSQPFVSMALSGMKPTGSKPGIKRNLNTYPEKEAAEKILTALQGRAGKKKEEWEEAKKQADRVEGIMRANGLIDNPRWRL